MSRPYPNRRRRRPGRRPPDRRPRGHRPAHRSGFTGPGFDRLYDRILPGLGGSEKRRYFNAVSGGIVLAAGLCGSILGLACFGWIGAIVGLGIGVSAGGSFAELHGFHRN